MTYLYVNFTKISSFLVVALADVSGSCLENLVSFMYSGNLRLTPETADIMLLVAMQLEITTVIELCQNYIENPNVSDPAEANEHNACDSDSNAQSYEVDEVVPCYKSSVKVKTENDDSVSDYALTRTTRSSSRKLIAEVLDKSSQISRPAVTASCEQTVIYGSRKRGYAAEIGTGSSASKKSLSIVSTMSVTGNDPDWTPDVDNDSRSQTHRYNTRKQSRHKLVLSPGLFVSNVRLKQVLSASGGNTPQPNHSSSFTRNQCLKSAAVYCLPAWRQSRKLLWTARIVLVKRTKMMDGGSNWQCRHCQSEGFTSRSHLNAHALCRHRKWRICFSCGQQVGSLLALIRHRNCKHRRLPCSRSEKSFTSEVDFESRLSQAAMTSVHNKCGWCGQKFTARAKLLEHRATVHRKRINTTSTPICRRVLRDWRCTEKDCGLEFKYKDKLRLHMAEQHPDVVFSCPECRFKTQVEQFLKRYIQSLCIYYSPLISICNLPCYMHTCNN